MANYNPLKIEKKWRQRWEKENIYFVKDGAKSKKNFYHLVMFPYPSGNLHIGHWYNFAPADIWARKKRREGYNVLSPFGFDYFGLPAENAAIKNNIHPKKWTESNIKRMRRQIKTMGNIYDWSREINTADPEYYKWTQWLFLKFYKNDLVYRKKTRANWCPDCRTVLANEQVLGGRCERCGHKVRQKEIPQWAFKITGYAKRLLRDLDHLDWPEETKRLQENWIGRSEGAVIKFQLLNPELPRTGASGTVWDGQISTFTTRADTLFGATYLVLAPEHPLFKNSKFKISNKVGKYIKKSRDKTEMERMDFDKEKTGVFTGLYAKHPLTGKKLPIWVSDYVLMSYGTGAIMAVPAHDERDWQFAKKFKLPIKKVVKPTKGTASGNVFVEDGALINSGKFNGLRSKEARDKIVKELKSRKLGNKEIQYRLRDWAVSRQRYWGTPIPIIYCDKCGPQPVSEKNLPIKLPEIKDYRSLEGKSPLARSEKFIKARCPRCDGKAERETDTLDTFVDSSWYFIRYADPRNEKKFAGKSKMKTWLPVDMYIGGKEHTVLHLMYARFFIKAMKDMNLVDFDEPFSKLRHQGIILGGDGRKMSKSRGNVVDPDDLVKAYGADVVRAYLGFMGEYGEGGPWQSGGITGVKRFFERVWNLRKAVREKSEKGADEDEKTETKAQKTIKKVTEDLEGLKFNTALSSLMVFANALEEREKILSKKLFSRYYLLLLLLLAPFAPHLTEEIWQELKPGKGGKFKSIHDESWPKYQEEMIKEDEIVVIIQVNGKLRGQMKALRGADKRNIQEEALALPQVKKWLEEEEIKKIIFIPDKLINFVV